ncbi:MAG: phospholipase D-like domain-containing protein [Planctomycetota bacterium]|jgi:cardiolipin synthase
MQLVALALLPACADTSRLVGDATDLGGHRSVVALDETAGVEIRGEEEWRRRVEEAFDSLAPAEGGCVVDLFARDELFLYRDRDGVLHAGPITDKPAEIPIVRSYQFRDVVRVLGKRPARALYVTGEPAYPMVFADAGRVVLLTRTAEPAKPRGGGLRLWGNTVGGQFKALVNRPASSMARLFTMTANSTVDLVSPEPLSMLNGKPVPAVTPREFMDRAAWERKLDTITGAPSSQGRMRYLVDGHEFFPRLVDRTVAATKSVDCRVYIFDNDDYAVGLAKLLRRKSADIGVRVLVDGMGTRGAGMAHSESLPAGHKPPPCILRYLRDGSDVAARALDNPWFAGDHTKAIVIDNEVAFMGGMNIGREYRYDWHDLMVELTGPVVAEIGGEFEHAWAGSESFGDFRRKPRNGRGAAATDQDYPVRLLYTRPGDSQILKTQLAAIRAARDRIYIETPYLTSDTVIFELARARRRGVDVRVILPAKGDSAIINKNHAHAANAMLKHGIRVYIYPGMSHLKAAVYDGWACIGSANMDNLSLRVNREMNIATSHAPAVERLVERVFEPDLERSQEMTEPVKTDLSHFFAELLSDGL